jgi:hypothetical protein
VQPLEALEAWQCGHKRRSVEIQIDDGYGANCWMVTLIARGIGKVEVSEITIMGEDGEEWPGLGLTILAAISKAEEAGL